MSVQITGNDAQFNKNVTILGDLKTFGNINQIEKFVLNLDSKEKLRITSDSVTVTDNINAVSANFSGIVTATKFSGPFEGTTGNFSGDVTIGGELTYEDVTNVDSVGVITARSGINVTGIVTATSFSGSGANLTGIVGVPTGCIIAWGGGADSIPTGFLLCKGDAVSRSTYATLFVAIGTLHGSGDGSSTFNLPDLKNRFVVGGGTGSNYSVGDTGGADSVTLSVSELPSHTHTHTKATHPAGSGPEQNQSGGPEDRTNFGDTGTTSPTGGGSAHQNRPPYYALCYIIKT